MSNKIYIDPDDLRREIDGIMQEVGQAGGNALDAACQEAAKQTAADIRAECNAHGWKKYGANWKSARERKTSGGCEYKVYNENLPGLTHLLENGHEIVTRQGKATGKRTKAIPHIAPAADKVGDRIEEAYQKALEKEL